MTHIEFNPANIRYMTGIDFSFAVMVFFRRKKYLFVDPRYHAKAASLKKISVVNSSNVFCELKKFLRENKIKEVSADLNYVTVKTKNDILKGVKLKFSDFISVKRAVKTVSEIKKITEASRISALAVKKTLSSLKEGVSEKEIARILKYSSLKLGADGVSFEPIVLFGKNTCLIHGSPSDFKLKKNMPVVIDFGVKVDGYSSDLTRTFYYGAAALEFKKIFLKVKTALEYAEKNIKAGNRCRTLDKLVKEKLKPYSLMHSSGHGIGLQTHELPFINRKSPHSFKNNMCFTVEPGIYIEGKLGVRLENTYLLSGNKLYNLTNKVKLNYEI